MPGVVADLVLVVALAVMHACVREIALVLVLSGAVERMPGLGRPPGAGIVHRARSVSRALRVPPGRPWQGQPGPRPSPAHDGTCRRIPRDWMLTGGG